MAIASGAKAFHHRSFPAAEFVGRVSSGLSPAIQNSRAVARSSVLLLLPAVSFAYGISLRTGHSLFSFRVGGCQYLRARAQGRRRSLEGCQIVAGGRSAA